MVVGMFYYEQMSVNEIAEALNCSANTVKSRLNYARKKIGKEIAELEKKGVILRTAAPIPILMYLFQKLRGVQEQIPKAKFLVKAGIEKAIVTGIAAAAICMGIGIGAVKIPDRHQQVQEIQEGIIYRDERVQVEAFAVSHGTLESYGYRFVTQDGVIVVSGDTAPLPVVAEKAKGCRHFAARGRICRRYPMPRGKMAEVPPRGPHPQHRPCRHCCTGAAQAAGHHPSHLPHEYPG